MGYKAAIGPEIAAKLGIEPNSVAHVFCDGCGAKTGLGSKHEYPAKWFLAGKPPRGWRGISMADRSRRWDLCPKCWKGEER